MWREPLRGVAVLYMVGFGCFRHPIKALIALMLPMAWSFGYVTLAVGHLNILSSAFVGLKKRRRRSK